MALIIVLNPPTLIFPFACIPFPDHIPPGVVSAEFKLKVGLFGHAAISFPANISKTVISILSVHPEKP